MPTKLKQIWFTIFSKKSKHESEKQTNVSC